MSLSYGRRGTLQAREGGKAGESVQGIPHPRNFSKCRPGRLPIKSVHPAVLTRVFVCPSPPERLSSGYRHAGNRLSQSSRARHGRAFSWPAFATAPQQSWRVAVSPGLGKPVFAGSSSEASVSPSRQCRRCRPARQPPGRQDRAGRRRPAHAPGRATGDRFPGAPGGSTGTEVLPPPTVQAPPPAPRAPGPGLLQYARRGQADARGSRRRGDQPLPINLATALRLSNAPPLLIAAAQAACRSPLPTWTRPTSAVAAHRRCRFRLHQSRRRHPEFQRQPGAPGKQLLRGRRRPRGACRDDGGDLRAAGDPQSCAASR